MQTIFRVSANNATRYIRAISAQAARVRAFKVWGMQAPRIESIGHQAPDIGTLGYREACRQIDARADNGVTLRAMQKSGPDTTRGFYRISEKQKTKMQNQAAQILKQLGLA